MAVNIFGSGPNKNSINVLPERGRPGIGFKYLDDEGNYDISNKRLGNIGEPIEDNDAVSKRYTDNIIDGFVDEINHDIAGLRQSKNEAKVLLRSTTDRVTGLEGEVDTVRREIEHDLPARLIEHKDILDVDMNKKLLEQRLYIDELVAGLRTYTSNFESNVQKLVEDVTSLSNIIAAQTDDVRINAGEIENVKAFVQTYKSKLTDIENSSISKELLDNALGVVNTTIAGLDESFNKYMTETNSNVERIDSETNLALSRVDDKFNRLVTRVNNTIDTSTEANILASRFEALEDRVTNLVRSNIELEERVRHLLPNNSRRSQGGGII